VDTRGDVKVTPAWTMPAMVPLESWDSYIDLQIEAFNEALRRIDLERTCLSLTGGLDTRTILAASVRDGRTVPAFTMSWKDVSLDARTATKLCRAYGIEHHVIRFDEAFARELPEYALAASRLSGGLASVGEATEVALYDRIGTTYVTRLSGYLGNQVGRGGVEQLSPRSGDLSILGSALDGVENGGRDDHWFYDEARTDTRLNLEFLLQREVLFASIGNFCLGNHFMVQQSPYASRSLIEATTRAPQEPNARAIDSVPRMRLNDLRHRFLGEAEERSFQRKLINVVGGYVAECPVNWGWRVSGGVAVKGVALGALTLVDAFVGSRYREESVVSRLLATLRISGLHDFRQLRRWCDRDFTYDTLRAKGVCESGILDGQAIERMLGEHFSSRRDHHRSLMLALDLAHAYQIYVSGWHEGGTGLVQAVAPLARIREPRQPLTGL